MNPTETAGATSPPRNHEASTDVAAGVFSRSVLISGIRCTLAYVIFPWVLPLVGVSNSVGPWIGIVIGVVAIGFNLASIKRFWVSRHRWRWPITAINASVIALLAILFVKDVRELAGK